MLFVAITSWGNKIKVAQISRAVGDWELVERDVPELGAGEVRVKVDACGICHSDVHVKDGLWPGLQYPRVPGHEVAGRIDALGDNVTAWTTGQRVGVGWHGGHDFVCEQCRHVCRCDGLQRTAQLRRSRWRRSGSSRYRWVGHLGVQYARQMGFQIVAINRGNDKQTLAQKLGAHHYIDATATDVVAELQKLGGARVILATAPSAQAISPLVDGLSPNGLLLVLAAPAEPLSINVFSLIMRRSSVAGWYSGTARDSQDTMEFSALSGAHPMIEKYPLDRVAEAYEQMHSGKVRFRVVLTMDGE